VLEDEVDDEVRLHLIYADRRHMPSKVRAFVDFMVEKYGEGRAPWLGV
jgi:DNA-binding transcriptional LysR family regulator